jgi:hypothetical protein
MGSFIVEYPLVRRRKERKRKKERKKERGEKSDRSSF